MTTKGVNQPIWRVESEQFLRFMSQFLRGDSEMVEAPHAGWSAVSTQYLQCRALNHACLGCIPERFARGKKRDRPLGDCCDKLAHYMAAIDPKQGKAPLCKSRLDNAQPMPFPH